MTGITVLLLAAAAGFGVSRGFGIPAIPVLVMGGVATTAVVSLPGDFLQDALLLGVTVLVFVAGIELNPGRVRGQKRAAVQVGLVQFFLLGAVGLAVALALGYSMETAAYLALALTASSTLVVVRVLQSRQQLFEPFGRLVTGVLLLQDLLVILAIPVITRLADGAAAVGVGLLSTLALVALAGMVHRWVAPLVRRLEDDEEVLLLVVLAILFGFLGLAYLFELPLIAGAFLAGISLSSFPLSALVRGKLNSLSDFFNALFFTALGAFLPVPSGAGLLHGLLLAVIVVVATPPLVAIIAERSGFSARPALAAGLILSQTSEFSLVIGLQGVVLGQITQEVFGVIAVATVITMILTPFLATDRVTWALMRIHPFKRRGLDPVEERPSGHVLLLGCGRNGVALLELLVVTPNELMVVDDDPALVERIQEAHVPAVRGDVSDVELLRRVGADRAKVNVSTIRRKEDNAPLLAMAHGIPTFVRTFNVEDAEWVRDRGGRPVLFSDPVAGEFMEWYRSLISEGRNTSA